MVLEHLIGRGLQKEPVNPDELRRFRLKVATKLGDARQTQISLDSRFDLAYEALLQIGLAALRANGLRPDSRGGHHILALQTLDSTIGCPRQKLRVLDEFRRRRAAGLYDGSFSPSEAEVRSLLRHVEDLLVQYDLWLHQTHPEIG